MNIYERLPAYAKEYIKDIYYLVDDVTQEHIWIIELRDTKRIITGSSYRDVFVNFRIYLKEIRQNGRTKKQG